MPLPTLAIRGNQIVEQGSGRPVLLRGVNRSGLEYSSPEGEGSLAKAGISESELTHIATNWNANIVRLPINQEWALARTGYCPERYLKAIDYVVNTVAQQGAYTLIDLQWLDAHTTRGTVNNRPNFVAPLPNADSAELWRQLATRWRGNSAVLYDIFNEPHDLLPDDNEPLVGLPGRRVGRREWHPWARCLVESIRSVHADALILISGLNWGYDLSGFPLPDVENVVYSTHVYPTKGRDWDHAFGNLSSRAPVFAAEWGGGPRDMEWGRRLATYLDTCNMGWTVWSWSDHPHLTRPDSAFVPTEFGHFVRAALRARPK